MTFGHGSTQANVGVPATDASCTQKVGGKKVGSGRASVLLIVLLIMGVLIRLWYRGSSNSQEFTAIIVTVVVVGLIGFVAALVRKPIPTSETETGQHSDAEPNAPEPNVGEKIPPQRSTSLKAIMSEAMAKKQRREEEAKLLQEEHRLAETLGRYKCFYLHNGERIGPVTLWQVREMVEADLFDPDIQVILEGSDYWYTYAEQELRVAPPSDGNTKALHAAAKLQCHYREEDNVRGPISLLVIFHKIRLGELPADVQIRVEGSQEWKRASDVLSPRS